MAIQTQILGTLAEVDGNAELQIDWDDATLLLRAVRVVNQNPTRTVRVSVGKADGTRTVTRDAPPNQTTTQNIPTTQAARLQLTIDANGRLAGVNYGFGWL